jgi:hypothetical protein
MSRTSLAVASWLLPLTACATLFPKAESNITASPSLPADVVWISGSSNFSSFTCRATDVAVTAEAALEQVVRARADGIPAVKTAALAIPVRSLDCGISEMNSDLYRTLHGDVYPTISFSMGDYAIRERGKERQVRMDGRLRINGQEQNIVVQGWVRRDRSGQLRFKGEREINMRNFGIKPPRKFLGLVRVRDQVTVGFDVAVRPLVDPLGILSSTIQ